jgi:hypothetical protein
MRRNCAIDAPFDEDLAEALQRIERALAVVLARESSEGVSSGLDGEHESFSSSDQAAPDGTDESEDACR